MKHLCLSFYLLLAVILLTHCSSSKNMPDNLLFNTEWELEYLSGPRIAFKGLFPDKKPQITFDPEIQKVKGNSGCNGYMADYTLDGESISFGEPGPTTMMYCGDGEKHFLNTMQKINRYRINEEGKLELMIDDVPMMRFTQN